MSAVSLEDLSHEQLLVHARQQEGIAQVANQLLSNPKTREMVQRAMKIVNPQLVIPEVDNKDAVSAALEEIRKDNKALEQRLLERDVKDRIREQRAAIKAKYNLTDAEVGEVEKLMVVSDDNPDPIATHDAAARVYRASRTPSTPTPAAYKPPTTYQMPEKDVWGPGIGNKAKLDRIALEQAHLAFAEVMGQRTAA